MKTAGIISLGCSRNSVDSEVIAGHLKRLGMEILDPHQGPDICIVNTCAFIGSAREESVDSILEAVQMKKKGRIKRLVVCGCLPQMYKDKLAVEIPEVDLFLGTSDFPMISDFIDKLRKEKSYSRISRHPDYLYDERSPRILSTPRHYAYVKISEGCSNFCSYCVISRLRGTFRSRSIESVVEEVRRLSAPGHLREIDLIGQDTTIFGFDRYGKIVFPELLRRLARLKSGVKWIRILYTHPAHYSDELISVVKDEAKVCKYLDLPVQHISDSVLKAMNRRTTRKEITALIKKLKKNIPGLVLRTSVIVGFPGESEKDFKELLSFVRDTGFDRLGAFIYSKEEGTKAARLESHISEEAKKERFGILMDLQRGISENINRSFLGKRIKVLIDEKISSEAGRSLGRTQGDAPEIDGTVYVSGKSIKTGEFCSVKVRDALEYDLVGEVVK